MCSSNTMAHRSQSTKQTPAAQGPRRPTTYERHPSAPPRALTGQHKHAYANAQDHAYGGDIPHEVFPDVLRYPEYFSRIYPERLPLTRKLFRQIRALELERQEADRRADPATARNHTSGTASGSTQRGLGDVRKRGWNAWPSVAEDDYRDMSALEGTSSLWIYAPRARQPVMATLWTHVERHYAQRERHPCILSPTMVFPEPCRAKIEYTLDALERLDLDNVGTDSSDDEGEGTSVSGDEFYGGEWSEDESEFDDVDLTSDDEDQDADATSEPENGRSATMDMIERGEWSQTGPREGVGRAVPQPWLHRAYRKVNS
ncbi:hypothetical protein C8Q77DRAFT_721432 [Trametes polyzona]|nr:hypothetical protein C8Q77DRAFT_721432 [Trametes polyzona]